MQSEDDPEARIRELEQPLAEAARASETSTNPPPGKWAVPPGPPPLPPSLPPTAPPYDGSQAHQPSGQGRTVWILLSVFVIAVIALPIGIFAFSTHQVSGRGVTAPSTPSMSSTSPDPFRTAPSTSAAAIPTPPTSLTTAPAGENIAVSGINQVRTIACNGGSVNVSGITNNVTITGHCTLVIVSGVQNQLTLDAADTIQASGTGNHVTYHNGSPRVAKSGFDNVIQKG